MKPYLLFLLIGIFSTYGLLAQENPKIEIICATARYFYKDAQQLKIQKKTINFSDCNENTLKEKVKGLPENSQKLVNQWLNTPTQNTKTDLTAFSQKIQTLLEKNRPERTEDKTYQEYKSSVNVILNGLEASTPTTTTQNAATTTAVANTNTSTASNETQSVRQRILDLNQRIDEQERNLSLLKNELQNQNQETTLYALVAIFVFLMLVAFALVKNATANTVKKQTADIQTKINALDVRMKELMLSSSQSPISTRKEDFDMVIRDLQSQIVETRAEMEAMRIANGKTIATVSQESKTDKNSFFSKKTTPIPSKEPKEDNPLAKRYAVYADASEGFTLTGLRGIADKDTVYEIVPISVEEAFFSIVDNYETHQRAISNVNYYLLPACEYDSQPLAYSRIVTTEKGKLQKKGNLWKIAQKAQITFE